MMRFKRKRCLRLAALALFLWLPLMPPAFADVAPDDPVVADVVRMLDAGIESDLIIRWIDSGEARPEQISADAMIALREANASSALIEHLLTLATAAQPAATVLQLEQGARTDDPVAPVLSVPASKAAGVPATSNVAANDAECCLVDFAVEYRATEDREGEELEQPGRDLFLYVDGQFLARLASQGNIASRGPERFKSYLAPGEHTLRLMRQLHTRKRGKNGGKSWDHETTVSPSSVRFRVEPGAQWQLELSWIQGEFSTRKPLTWRWLRNGAAVSGEEKSGEFREDWPYLCEDAVISRENGAIGDWRSRDRQKGCVSWASLWPSAVPTTRAKVLEELGATDYAPPLR